jgi:ATP-dependent DNA ligase
MPSRIQSDLEAVSKRLTGPYRSGPSRDWLKVKNPDSPAMIRAGEHFARVGQ